MAESNRVVSRLMSFILLFDCQEAFHCCLVVACSNRINMISIQCHRVGEWSAGKPEFEKVSIPVWGNHDSAGLNEVHIPFKNYVVFHNKPYPALVLYSWPCVWKVWN